eukprot:jgi/Astpho2/2765/Aster-00940
MRGLQQSGPILFNVLRQALAPAAVACELQGSRAFASAALPQPTDDHSGPQNVKEGKVLHPDLLNENLKKTEYAVRGELYMRAEELRKAGKEIIFTNVGNPQALGQKPLTFNRQVQALVSCPSLLEHPEVGKLFPKDAIARAKHMLTLIPGGVGAYTDSRGAPGIRQEIADFIERRDGVPSNPDHIFITDGASPAVRMMLNAIIRDERDGLLVPIPQYPLYSASIQLLGGSLVPYYLNEKDGWSMNIKDLRQRVDTARSQGLAVRGLVFINPGNPTGQCLTKQNLQELIQFCADEHLVLMADEVYQENIFTDDVEFHSAKAVLAEMGGEIAKSLELASFHTVSKGALGECGLRGGYVELTNMHPKTVEELYKVASINLAPNSYGQVSLSLSMNPPKQGEESYDLWKKERDDIIASMTRRAHIMTDGFNSLEGVSCNFTEGAMYSFPQIHLPSKAMEAAKKAGKPADVFYCLKLLEATGISTVPGSGFGQEKGTLHFRTTILPPEAKIKAVVERLSKFHGKFMDEYR